LSGKRLQYFFSLLRRPFNGITDNSLTGNNMIRLEEEQKKFAEM
jgi:hypothetical protein